MPEALPRGDGDVRMRTTASGRRLDRIRRLLLAVDVGVMAGAVAIAALVTNDHDTPVLIAFLLAGLAFMAADGLYGRGESQIDRQTADDLPGLVRSISLAGFAVVAAAAVWGAADGAVEGVLVAWALLLPALPLGRIAARARARRHSHYRQATIVLGAGHVGQLVARKIRNHPEYGLRLEGFVDANPLEIADEPRTPVLGRLDQLDELVALLGVERVIVAFSMDGHADLIDALDGLRERGVRVDVVPRLYGAVGPRFEVSHLEGLPLLTLRSREPSATALRLKRALDVLVAGTLLVLTAPIFATIALAVRIDSAGPVLYRGRRVGTTGGAFHQLKFRTMRPEWCTPNGADDRFLRYLDEHGLAEEFALTQKLRDDPRVTPIGRFLRRTSLDELPQLLNVLRGDLALVGPRPITESERTARYWDEARGRPFLGYWQATGLRPGLTGWWQINGRSTMSFDERIRLDTAYLTNWSLGLDLHILAKTVRTLVSTSGAY